MPSTPNLPWTYFPQWLDDGRAEHLMRTGWEDWPWEQGTVSLFGRLHLEPRRSFFQADEGCDYRYAGRTLRGQGWHPDLAQLRSEIETELGTPFNSVLVNAYRNGRDYMGYHQDNEPELGPHPHVASLSLGASRDFILRSKDASKKRFTLALNSGDLLWMQPPCQHLFEHALPKRLRVDSPRINLTFRQIVPVLL